MQRIEMTKQPKIYLREWRQYVSITQQELVQRSGVSLTTISKVENRHYGAYPGTRRKLAEALGIKPYQLLILPPGMAVAADREPEDATED